MTYGVVLRDVKGRAMWLTLNRPQVLNAINDEILLELNEGLDEAERDPDVIAVVITGSGEKAFSAGADIEFFRSTDIEQVKSFAELGHRTILRIMEHPKPIIAAINGIALGGGCELAMACDIRIASENARLGQPEPRLGIIPGWGGTQLMPMVIGRAKAKELLLTGRIIDAHEAERIGLVHKVVPQAELEKAVMRVVEEISSLAPIAIRTIKRVVNVPIIEDLKRGLKWELENWIKCYQTEDRVEGIKAFLEKRRPSFKGI